MHHKKKQYVYGPNGYILNHKNTIETPKRKNYSGHDNISLSLLKDLKHELAHSLTLLINKSFHNVTVP